MLNKRDKIKNEDENKNDQMFPKDDDLE